MEHPTCCSILPNYIVRGLVEELEGSVHQLQTLVSQNELAIPEVNEKLRKWKEHLLCNSQIMANAKAHALESAVEGQGENSIQSTSLFPDHVEKDKAIPEHATQQVGNMHNSVDKRFVHPSRTDTVRSLPGDIMKEPDFDETCKQVHTNSESVFQFYKQVLDRNSIDGKGMKLVSSVHFGKNYANAFWTDYLSQMVYGDGDPDILINITKVVDVAGHEMTHGFLSKQAPLEYYKESGALNESIADIFGIMVKQWASKQKISASTWLVGEDTIPGGKGLRSFTTDPANKYDIQPKSVEGMRKMQNDPRYQEYLEEDEGGVHIFSGIPNHVFYLFCKTFGDDTYSWETAGRVWYKTVMSGKVNKRSSFEEFANLTVLTANEIFGQKSALDLRKAWEQVGVLEKMPASYYATYCIIS